VKIVLVLRALLLGACAALLGAQLLAADSPREHIPLDVDWKFHLAVKNDGGQGDLNPNVDVDIIGKTIAVPWSRSLFNVLAQVIVRSTGDAGELKLSASGDGLAPARAVVQTWLCAPRPSAP
jgi:hypothetical protein